MAKRKRKKTPGIDFDKKLQLGARSYDTEVGDWWVGQSENAAHKRAYRNIAQYIAAQLPGRKHGPLVLVDFACGHGAFLLEMLRQRPSDNYVAIDGSKKMLEQLSGKLDNAGHTAEFHTVADCLSSKRAQVRLVQSRLPNFAFPSGLADAVLFVFPNIAPGDNEQEFYDRHGYKNKRDVEVARMLARFREMDPEDEVTVGDPEEVFDSLMTDKVINRSIRRMLKPGGTYFKVDYANAPREQLGQVTQLRCAFTDGALDQPVKGKSAEQLFRYEGNRFFRSSVILDVYHQTHDPSDKTGGYFISHFTAV